MGMGVVWAFEWNGGAFDMMFIGCLLQIVMGITQRK